MALKLTTQTTDQPRDFVIERDLGCLQAILERAAHQFHFMFDRHRFERNLRQGIHQARQ